MGLHSGWGYATNDAWNTFVQIVLTVEEDPMEFASSKNGMRDEENTAPAAGSNLGCMTSPRAEL